MWLQLILENVLWAFIENPGYSLADVPMFLNPSNEDFRNHIISNIRYNTPVADFWRYEFFSRREQTQQERVDSALTRLNSLLNHPYVRDIVGQAKTTIDFANVLSTNKVILLKLSANLPEDVKKFVGTILLNELVHAVRSRPEDKRTQFCIFIDEFHNFASSDYMATMVTEGRKFGVASTFLHVERFGQLVNNQKLMGATQAIVNKVLFQATVKDAEEFAPEFAKTVEPTEIRREAELVFSPHAVEDIWDRSHPDEHVADMRQRYFWIVEEIRRNQREQLTVYNPSRIPYLDYFRYAGNMHFNYFDDWEYYAANTDMLRKGIELLNRHYYYWMSTKSKKIPDGPSDVAFEIIECLGGVWGLRPSMEPYISEPMRHALLRALRGFRVPSCYEHFESKYSPTSKRTFPSHNIIHESSVKRTLENPNFPRTLLSLDSSDMNRLLRQIDELRWHANRPMGEVDFYRRRILFHAIVGLPNPDPWPDIECIPTTFTDLAHLHAIRQLALFIGMPPHEIENLISWRPRPLDSTERKLFYASYKLNTREPLKSMWLKGVDPFVAWKAYRDEWLAYYGDKLKMPQQVINVNQENQTEIHTKMMERAAWRMCEVDYGMLFFYWQVATVLSLKPIKIQSGKYDESLRIERPQHDLVTDMELELSRLPRYEAYAKLIDEVVNKQVVRTHRIQTHPLPAIQSMETESQAIANGHTLGKKRIEIKAEIEERQKRWLPGSDKPTTRGR